MEQRANPSPILWQNQDNTITLIDIPHSIAHAQQHSPASRYCYLLSSPPLLTPFPSNEPKTAAARAKLAPKPAESALHVEYKTILEQALDKLKQSYRGEWCLPRDISSGHLPDEPPRNAHQDTEPGLCTNPSNDTIHLALPSANSPTPATYLIPPNSSFYLSSCADVRAFHAALRNQAQQSDTRRHFDFILLDPPWPNRSVRRTHKTPGSTYAAPASLRDVHHLLLGMDLDMLMADDALVAVWITNKAAVRELVLGEGGLFDCCDVEVVEEWLWLKTTILGEPVTELAGLWRRPYEVLLLGRRKGIGARLKHAELKRRVIFAVPDLHSRKPCLKALVEPMMPNENDYRALEVFARNLVAGWWSWGDECIKFNWEGFWRARNDVSSTNDPVMSSANIPGYGYGRLYLQVPQLRRSFESSTP